MAEEKQKGERRAEAKPEIQPMPTLAPEAVRDEKVYLAENEIGETVTGAGGGEDPPAELGRPREARPKAPAQRVQRADLPGADADGRGSGAPFPLRLESLLQSGGVGGTAAVGDHGLRWHQGAAPAPTLPPARGR